MQASNPGQFESDVDVIWQKGQTQDAIYHAVSINYTHTKYNFLKVLIPGTGMAYMQLEWTDTIPRFFCLKVHDPISSNGVFYLMYLDAWKDCVYYNCLYLTE